jgi:hypothetical protein
MTRIRASPHAVVAHSSPRCCPSKPRDIRHALVIFADGPIPLGNDEFFVTYGAADNDVGVAKIKVALLK